MLVCQRRWLPDRDLVVVVADGGYAKREFLRHCQNMSKPIVVVAPNCASTRPAIPARATAAARPDRAAPGGRRAIAPVPRRCWTIPLTRMDSLPRHRFRRQYCHGQSSLRGPVGAVVPPTGTPRLPIRWVVIRYLVRSAAGPMLLLCTDTAAEPLRILQWYLLRWQVEVTFEELRAHLGMETQRQWSERAIARTTRADLWPVQRGDAGSGYPDRTAGWNGARAPRRGMTKLSPSFADAIALVRRHLWVQQVELLCRPSASTNR